MKVRCDKCGTIITMSEVRYNIMKNSGQKILCYKCLNLPKGNKTRDLPVKKSAKPMKPKYFEAKDDKI